MHRHTGHSNSRRLNVVLPYLYPNLKSGKDWQLYNESIEKGTQIRWLNKDVPLPTDKELLDGKKGSMIRYWWVILRDVRNKLLQRSDSHAMPDRPDSDKWISYRKKLRDLPEKVNPPSFQELDNESPRDSRVKIEKLMPTKP